MAIIIDFVTRKVVYTHTEAAELKERIKARFGDTLPKHFESALSKPQVKPYMHGDVHNVSYRVKTKRHNQPMPVPCEFTAESCLKREDAYILGDRCIDGIDEPCPWLDTKYGVTLSFLRSLPDGTKVFVTTRSDLVATEDYARELKRLDSQVYILAVSGMDAEWDRANEPGAPSRERRINAVKVLRDAGIMAMLELHHVPTKAKKGQVA